MIWISSEELAKRRELYKKGTRVELVYMDDAQAPRVGTRGTVVGVDDTGSVEVHWDNGSMLSVLYGIDECKIIVNDEPTFENRLVKLEDEVSKIEHLIYNNKLKEEYRQNKI